MSLREQDVNSIATQKRSRTLVMRRADRCSDTNGLGQEPELRKRAKRCVVASLVKHHAAPAQQPLYATNLLAASKHIADPIFRSLPLHIALPSIGYATICIFHEESPDEQTESTS